MAVTEEAKQEEEREQDNSSTARSSTEGLRPRVVAEEEHEDPNGNEEQDEEGRKPTGIREPKEVSRAKRAEHELTHTPYREWCTHCVLARGRGMQHRKQEKEDAEMNVPRVSMDYFFLSDQDQKAEENPFIVLVDEQTGEKFARATGMKGWGRIER